MVVFFLLKKFFDQPRRPESPSSYRKPSSFTQITHIAILVSCRTNKMPKILNRCRRHQNHHDFPTMSSSILMAASPRIVSFEDNFPSSTSATDLVSENRQQESIKPFHKLSSLARRKSSLSLVELAVQGSNKPPAGSLPAPVSPPSSPALDAHPSSPWGHFVDMQVSDEEYGRTNSTSPQVYHGQSCRGCFSCGRKRFQPYGDYRPGLKAAPKGFLLDGTGSSSFRLTLRPQAETAEHLIGALDRLQVD